MEGLGRLLSTAFNVLILRIVLLGSWGFCCARDLQVLQVLKRLKRHLKSLVSLLKGCSRLRLVCGWLARSQCVWSQSVLRLSGK